MREYYVSRGNGISLDLTLGEQSMPEDRWQRSRYSSVSRVKNAHARKYMCSGMCDLVVVMSVKSIPTAV